MAQGFCLVFWPTKFGLHRDWAFWVVARVTGFGDNLVGHLHPFNDFTESGVLAIEESGFGDADKELAAAGISLGVAFIPEPGGGNGAPLVFISDFSGDGVARTTRAVGTAIVGIFTFGIAALDHEVRDDAVEGGAIVKSIFDQLFEIFGVLGAFDDIEFDDDDAVVGG